MKHVVTYILKEEGGESFHLILALSKKQDPEVVITKLLTLKNNTLLQGEKRIALKMIRPRFQKCMQHDWAVVGNVYKCLDCGVLGKRESPMLKIKPINKDKKYRDCSWKCKF